ncbi:carbohydrate ABC transporter permease [Paenibacillus fonticola]|uniref:carbohydrate ABC transporter permease n=1 Tax=Paenibacillus fonticola TaxID=379896 RepID=UPI00036EBECA|nr:sugar ABC transporter permease [Paenibacillus fonticola]
MRFYNNYAYLFLIPTVLGLLFFRLIPIAISIFAGFTNWDIYSPPQWTGLSNYVHMFRSEEFWSVLKRTFEFSFFFTAGVCVLGLFFAVMLNQRLRGIHFFRGLFFMPVITSVVAVGILWDWILSPQFGVLNSLLNRIFHLTSSPSWLGDQKYALGTLIVVYIWKSVGYQMIIYLAGLQHIPGELREAARIDGANEARSFFSVTLPLLTPTLFFVLIITIIQSFHTFDITYSLTRGGPYQTTTTLSYYIYQNAFVHYRMGYASGLAYILFFFTLIITWLNFVVKKKWVNYQ